MPPFRANVAVPEMFIIAVAEIFAEALLLMLRDVVAESFAVIPEISRFAFAFVE